MNKTKNKTPLKYFFLGCFICLFFFNSLIAQTDKTITLDEAVSLGLKVSEQLKGDNARLNAVQAKRLQYWNAQLPGINATVGYTRISDNVTPFSVKFPGATDATVLNPQILNQFNMRLGAQQIVFAGNRAINFYKSAELLEKATALDVEKDKTEVKNLVETTFLNILKLQRTEKILKQNAGVLTSRKSDAANFFKNGTGLENDVLKADLALLQVKTSLSEVQNSIAALTYSLGVGLKLPDDTHLVLDETGAVSENRELSDLASYQKMVELRPDINAAGIRQQSSETLLEVAKGNYFPVVSVFAGINNNSPNQRVFPQEDQFKATWDAGVTLSYNITNLFTNKYQISEAKANIDGAHALRNLLLATAKSDISNAYYACLTAKDKVQLYKQAITQTTENARVIKSRYNSQISTISELLDADFLVLQAQINLENAIIDAEIAYRKLLKTVAK